MRDKHTGYRSPGPAERRDGDAPDRRGDPGFFNGRGYDKVERSRCTRRSSLRGMGLIASLVAVFAPGGPVTRGAAAAAAPPHASPLGTGTNFLWFAQGTASSAPVATSTVPSGRSRWGTGRGPPPAGSVTSMARRFMAIYVTSTGCLAGGSSATRKATPSGPLVEETFGLFLGMAWACTGLYFLVLFYRHDIFKS